MDSSSSGFGDNAYGNENMPDAAASNSSSNGGGGTSSSNETLGGDPPAAGGGGGCGGSSNKKRKARVYATANLDPKALLVHKRDVSRRSSQRHRQKERLLTLDFIKRQTQLEDTNQNLKKENERLRSNIQAVRVLMNTTGIGIRKVHNDMVHIDVNITEGNDANQDKKVPAILPPPSSHSSGFAIAAGGSDGPSVAAALVCAAPALPNRAPSVVVPASAIGTLAHAPPGLNPQPLPCMAATRQVCPPQVPIRSGIPSGGGSAFDPPHITSRPATTDAAASGSLARTASEPAAILNDLTLEEFLTLFPSLASSFGNSGGGGSVAAAAAAVTQPTIQHPRPAATGSPTFANILSDNVAGIRQLNQMRRALLLEQDIMLASFIAKDNETNRANALNKIKSQLVSHQLAAAAAAPAATNNPNDIASLAAAILASKNGNGSAGGPPAPLQQLLLEQLQRRSWATRIMPPPVAAAAAVPVPFAASAKGQLQQREQLRQPLAREQEQRSPPPHLRPPVVTTQFSASPNAAAAVLLLQEIMRRGQHQHQHQHQQGPDSSFRF